MTIWGHDVVDIFFNLLPLILFGGVWAWFCLRLPRFQKEYLAILTRQVETLERIATALEKRSA